MGSELLALKNETLARELAYRGTMQSVSAAFRDHHRSSLRQLLDQAPEEHRGWGWLFFAARTNAPSFSFQVEGSVHGGVIIPDGELLCRVESGSLVGYRIEDGSTAFEQHLPCVNGAVAFVDPETTLIYSGGTGRTPVEARERILLEWKIGGELRTILREDTPDAWNFAYDRACRRIMLESRRTHEFQFLHLDGTIEPFVELPFPISGVGAIRPVDNAVICILENQEHFGLVELETGGLRYTINAYERGHKFSPDGRFPATGGSWLRLWDAATGELIHEWPGRSSIGNIAFDPTGAQIAFTDAARVIRILRTDDFEEIAAIRSPTDEYPGSFKFTPDGYWGDRGFIRAYDVESGRVITEIDLEWPGVRRVVHDLAVSPDGRTLVAQVSVRPGVRLVAWDTTTGRLLNSRPIGRLEVIHFLSDGSLLASVDGILRIREPARIMDPETLEDIHVFEQFDYAAASGDGARIAQSSIL